MIPAHKAKDMWCVVCSGTFSSRMIRQQSDANMLSIGARIVGEGLVLDIVDASLATRLEGGRHAMLVEMIDAIEG